METVMELNEEVKKEQDATLFSKENEKFLTFVLDGEEYGIEILRVREIIGMMEVTPVPQSQLHLKGIINLRGRVIPIFDLRLIFGMSEKEHDNETCIIIVDVDKNWVGVIVDTVSEVMDVNKKDVEFGSDLERKVNTEYIYGISKVKNNIKILVDIDKIFKDKELSY